MSEPNRENICAWVDALRSGRFKQGRSRLAIRFGGEEEHCCLGVASVLAMESGVSVDCEWTVSTRAMATDGEQQAVFTWAGEDRESSFLPDPVATWLGLPSIPLVGVVHSLSALNDGGHDYNQIADLIEAEWLTDAPAEATP